MAKYFMPDYDYIYPDYDRDNYPCPECGVGTMRPGPLENYGADRDGNRGVMKRTYGCDMCGYEEYP